MWRFIGECQINGWNQVKGCTLSFRKALLRGIYSMTAILSSVVTNYPIMSSQQTDLPAQPDEWHTLRSILISRADPISLSQITQIYEGAPRPVVEIRPCLTFYSKTSTDQEKLRVISLPNSLISEHNNYVGNDSAVLAPNQQDAVFGALDSQSAIDRVWFKSTHSGDAYRLGHDWHRRVLAGLTQGSLEAVVELGLEGIQVLPPDRETALIAFLPSTFKISYSNRPTDVQFSFSAQPCYTMEDYSIGLAPHIYGINSVNTLTKTEVRIADGLLDKFVEDVDPNAAGDSRYDDLTPRRLFHPVPSGSQGFNSIHDMLTAYQALIKGNIARTLDKPGYKGLWSMEVVDRLRPSQYETPVTVHGLHTYDASASEEAAQLVVP
jgi:hypothetical protein